MGYATGAIQLSSDDLPVAADGAFFGMRRAYGNRSSTPVDGPAGFNWMISQRPAAANVNATTVGIVFSPTRVYWFHRSGSDFVPHYGSQRVSLHEDPTSHVLTFVRTSGTTAAEVTVFNSLSASTGPGMFVSHTDARGVQSIVASQTGSQVNELQRTYAVGGTTYIDSLLYAYVTFGPAAGKLQTVTYRRKIGSGSWTSLRRVAYAYYGAADANGSVNDLRSATQQLPDGSGGWDDVALEYYRYYLSGAAHGFAHGLKMHFGPEACRLMFNAGIDPATAADAAVLPYADHYFEYDPTSRRVTKETSSVCESCPGGGTSTDLFAYNTNPRGAAPGYNTWQTRAVQTLPDGSKIIVYSNYAGMRMLYANVEAAGTRQWITYYRYNDDGQKVWEAHPSAVNGYDDGHDDLMNFGSGGTSPFLNDGVGLIEVTDYYDTTDLPNGQVQGYVSIESVQEGQGSTPVALRSYTYTSHTDDPMGPNPITVYPVASETAYPVEGSTTTTVVTTYDYAFYSGTNVLQQKTTTLPAVPSGQNGDGTAPTVVEEYDAFGYPVQRTDERGVVNTYAYDALGRVTQQVLNYQSGVTQPGVNVTTDFTYDDLGRLVRTLGPSHTAVLSGTATTVRRATWNVYVRSVKPSSGTWVEDEDRTAAGYATGTGPGYSYSLVDPVSLTRRDKDGRVTDRITSKRTSGSGALSAGDTFAQADWQGWSSTQYNERHQKVSDRAYFLIPASGTGVAGTNYGQSDYGYDALERLNRVRAAGGTVTRTVWTAPQRVASTWVGTDDAGATDDAPYRPPTFVRAANADNAGTSVSATLTGVAPGNTLVAYAASKTTTAPTGTEVTDNRGNAWRLVRAQAGASAAAGSAGFWVAYDVPAGSVTVTFAGAAAHCAIVVAEYAGLARVQGVDASQGGSSASSSTTANAGNLATGYPLDLVLGAASQAQGNVTWGAATGYTLRASSGTATNMAIAMQEKVVDATGSYAPSLTLSSAQPWTALAVALVAANNMVKVTDNQYDGGSDGGDGNLTQITQYAGTSDTRVTGYGYDFRDRRTIEDGEVDSYAAFTYDNLNRVTQVDRYDTTDSGNLIARSATLYDDRGRVYRQVTYAVDPSTGSVGNALTANNWYDYAGNLLQSVAAGDGQVFTKHTYNDVGWVTATYRGYNTGGTSYSQANDVSGDTIFQQVENAFDEAGNVVSTASFARLNDAPSTGTGSTGALSYGTNPKARVSYAAAWHDGVDRAIASANYGAIASFTRPSTPPSSSDTVLVSLTSYDDAGRVRDVTDPLGLVARTNYDAAGRTTQTIEDHSASSGHLNRTTNYAYTIDGQVATLTAVNADTGDQTTAYVYGTRLGDSGVARNDLLRYTAYPGAVRSWATLSVEDWATLTVDDWAQLEVDPTGGDVTAVTYNRLGERQTFTDQRGTVRRFDRDKLGRQLHDRVTTVGTDTDNAVRRISTSYESRGMVAVVTTYDNATVGSGTALNQVKLDYNDFAQLVTEWQSHGGTVTGSTPSVQYAYDSGASNSNQARLNQLTYPDGRQVAYDYGTSGGVNDYLNRVENLIHDPAGTPVTLAGYAYLGLGTVIQIDYPDEPQVRLDLWGGTSGTFAGLDRFGRVVDQRWVNYSGTPTDLDRFRYGYDRNSNRQYKANVVGTAAVAAGLDEYYTYDNLNRLTVMKRGVLNSSTPPTGNTGTPAREMDYTLDPTGNWNAYLTKTSGTTDLNQGRTQNTVNEITAITSSGGTPLWVTPAYDAAGNTTTMPQVVDPTLSFTALYDAWNRMVELSDSGGTVATYAYDGRNRRVVKVTTATSETRHVYWTNAWQDVEERVGSATTADLQYVWGLRYVDELVCRDDATPQRLYAMQDANFNLTSICDTAGAVQERYRFEPYGNCVVIDSSWTAISATAFDWIVGHQGLTHDPESAIVYNRNRYLLSGLGRFGSRDPIGYSAWLNLYQICLGNPLASVDPDGKKHFEVDESTCTITLAFSVGIKWRNGRYGRWTASRKDAFEQALKSQVEGAFNTNINRIRARTGSSCCQCSSWSPNVSVHVGGGGFLGLFVDFTLDVEANPNGAPYQSSADLGGPHATLDEDDVNSQNKGLGYSQVPAAHEVGHLLGIAHPGDYPTGTFPPGHVGPPGFDPAYDADISALMGRGMQLRPEYFKGWADELDEKYPDCSPHQT